MSLVDLSEAAFVHPSAHVYGRVKAREGTSIWVNAVIRAEAAHVEIGRFTNIQDFVMIHTDPGRPVVIGDYCSITHHATIHGSTIGHNVLVGINATIYGGAHIGDNSIVGQHAYVKDGTIVPPNSIVVGAPAKVIRMANNWVANRMNALFYHRNALAYARGDHRAWDGPEFERWLEHTLEALQAEFAALEAAAPAG
ncbi:MAG: gamma carbonic anhydrase family protein [Sphingomonadaceae bacterium]|uniref:gamma carbonic anhydrase family protein n=1 Tax=Thermaurantiacus sp. TaxID=2820283 RepID=UPI00298F1C05|nr:gamma carbonic anhydrase family protein [Thermaurantiacus sp.]MCS6986781.1 gamma carbonic anhydrase family protein [Sphingomonadaceae bacterium]MDW8413956.1 gamma carbonic anhydrase family protein [Thermaurantiacus sp.]